MTQICHHFLFWECQCGGELGQLQAINDSVPGIRSGKFALSKFARQICANLPVNFGGVQITR